MDPYPTPRRVLPRANLTPALTSRQPADEARHPHRLYLPATPPVDGPTTGASLPPTRSSVEPLCWLKIYWDSRSRTPRAIRPVSLPRPAVLDPRRRCGDHITKAQSEAAQAKPARDRKGGCKAKAKR